MKTRFSKCLGDVSLESRALLRDDAAWREKNQAALAALAGRPRRETCLVCRASLNRTPTFMHRGQSYVCCRDCGHIMLGCLPPEGYPRFCGDRSAFEAIYPPRSPEALAERRRRIYQPKLDWILDAAARMGRDRHALLALRWVEFGCGEGQFLLALEETGGKQLVGVESDPGLAKRARQGLRTGRVDNVSGSLAEHIREMDADIYAAFFVLEHTQDLNATFRALAAKAPGTLFAFSVPMFSLATALESAFDIHAARNLDSVVHTQLFTDASIARCLEIGGLEMVSQWVFGQDANDLRRLLIRAVEDIYPEELLTALDRKLAAMEDGLQQAVDRAMFCDARHVLAVRRA